jgi:hypothetical protein
MTRRDGEPAEPAEHPEDVTAGGAAAPGPAGPVLARLFAARGLPAGAWWPFLVQEEGKALPGGLESLSGFVLTRAGDVYGWWLDWDAGAPGGGDYVFDRWWRVARPGRAFATDAEYRRARRGLGLA